MKNKYFGCKSADEAAAKIVFYYKSFGGYTLTCYWADSIDAVDYLNNYKKSQSEDFNYEIYLRDVNFNSGRIGGAWWRVEHGSKNSAHSTITIMA